ncbi:hypothetical protein J8I87_06160 [Paraburkholderia sp. LEh10]|nr:hypothetical protein [Paraburkholderia sp. LEh10]MBP0589308.1 hypothetical protein [Paraburkholderia sp. LEh10]
MNRVAFDNDLLAACERTHGVTALLAILLFIAIGCGWFLCVAVPAGAVWK